MMAKVKDIEEGSRVETIPFVEPMCGNIGKILEFKKDEATGPGWYKSGCFYYHESWLEFLEDEKPEPIDQCKDCIRRGDLKACLENPCGNRGSWYAHEVMKNYIEAIVALNGLYKATLAYAELCASKGIYVATIPDSPMDKARQILKHTGEVE